MAYRQTYTSAGRDWWYKKDKSNALLKSGDFLNQIIGTGPFDEGHLHLQINPTY